jgi:hypothetical protein
MISIGLLGWHPFSILMEPDSAIVCDNAMHFPEGTFMGIIKTIMKM